LPAFDCDVARRAELTQMPVKTWLESLRDLMVTEAGSRAKHKEILTQPRFGPIRG
jgi:hypothetical protein